MGKISRALRLLSWVLVLLLLGVTLDVSLNDGAITRKYLPHSVLEELEGLRDQVASRAEDYLITEAFERYLNDPHELSVLRNLSSGLRGKDVVSSAWNVLLWEDGHLSYDHNRTEPTFIPPSQFISRGKGICGDYALLTAGLLLVMNYSPVYVLSIEFNDSEVGHLTAAIAVRGRYLVADQHPPLMDLASYYRHWALYVDDPAHISRATVYVLFWKGGRVVMRRYRELSWRDFLAQDYNMSERDLESMSEELLRSFEARYDIAPDPGLPRVAEEGVSERYHWISMWQGLFPGYADYYLPVTEEEMVDYMLDQMEAQGELGDKLRESRAFWLELSRSGANLTLTVYLAG
ncbi:transglutaminase-like domain-containing protein [Thermococcus sp. AM4]|uniref:transglutaminase-like domain-containing protein n=1 Tax=Thermococcus sp. (strain AM4) TaxID=246969 RepID=UPI00018712A2|nr:transglutaminase-like domain-containing protein [Thermococcus sp. AM4]EEB73521.1 conserved hypothetical protein [Thermococcus sp. AM4]